MGIRDQIAAYDARFISFPDLLDAVAEADGVTKEEAARAFHITDLLYKVPHWFLDYGSGKYCERDGDSAHCHLLFILNEFIPPSLQESAEWDDRVGVSGFLRDEIATALKECGLIVPACLIGAATVAATAKPASQNRPDLLPFVPRVNVALYEAANLLSEANGGNWRASLEDAADSGLIQSGGWSMDRGEQPLSHADIRAWCEAAGAVWPVPLPPGAEPTTDHSLREALAESREEADRLRAEITHLKSELGALQAKNAGSNDTADSDPSVTQAPRTGVSVNLPHMTRGLESLFCVMREQWSHYSQDNPPKSSVVADALDSAMGWNAQKSGEASRNAQALASLIRPDEIADADPRNARRR